MHVHVLTAGYWPTYTPVQLIVPPELRPYLEVFENFYRAKYQGRQLQWQQSLGQCVLRARFPKGTKELSVSLLQTLVLLCFNNQDEISFKEVKSKTGIGE